MIENKEVDIKRVYNSLAVVVIGDIILLLLLTISIHKDINVLYWLSIIFLVISVIPLIGAFDLIYHNRKG